MPELETFNAHQILCAIDQFLEYGEDSFLEAAKEWKVLELEAQ